MKIVINRCFGGFGLSEEAYRELELEWDSYGCAFDGERTSPRLIACVEKIGSKKASGALADLLVVEIPDDTDWYIDNYDGIETVHEKHRSWPE